MLAVRLRPASNIRRDQSEARPFPGVNETLKPKHDGCPSSWKARGLSVVRPCCACLPFAPSPMSYRRTLALSVGARSQQRTPGPSQWQLPSTQPGLIKPVERPSWDSGPETKLWGGADPRHLYFYEAIAWKVS